MDRSISTSSTSEPISPTPGSYRLLALDLDGTVLDPHSRITQATAFAVRAACDAGLNVVLASGRSPRQMRFAHDELGLTTPVVAYHGAVVTDLRSGEVLHHEPVQLGVARRVLDILRRHHPAVNVHIETIDGGKDAWHVDQLDDRVKSFVEKYNTVPPDTVGEIQRLLRDETLLISRLWFRAPADVMTIIKEQLLGELGSEIETLAFDDVSLTVMTTGVTKATAIAWLALQYGVPREQVMAVGDEINDIPLLGWAGLGVAMQNAREPVKRFAHVITGTNAEDGAAQAIWRYALGRPENIPSLTSRGD